MTALNKQALREAAQEEIMLRSVSDTSDAWQDEASPEAVLALLDELDGEAGRVKELESQRALAFTASNRWADKFREAERKLEAAEKRIAELEARTVTLPQYRNSPDMHTKQFYEAIGFNQGLDIFIEALRAAGIGVKGE